MEPHQSQEDTPISDNKKRSRVDDSDSHSQDSKLARVDDSDDHAPDLKLARVDSVESELCPTQTGHDSAEPGFDSENAGVNSPEAKRIQDELLSVFDDSDEPSIQGLDSVIKSFEDEILQAPAELTSFSDEGLSGLGYLLEASDDELGLPPTIGEENNFGQVENGGSGGNPGAVGDLYEEMGKELGVGYESLELGIGDGNESYNEGEGFVTLGEVFDYSDDCLGSGDISGLQWQAESLPAL